jgi:uncharacterized protein YecT (DUF1311 family)
MKDGDIMRLKIKLLLLILLCITFNAFAIDNPQRIDLYKNFQKKTNSLTLKISQETDDSKAIIMYSEYNKYLEKELNTIYSKLLKEVNIDNKKKLIESQKKWLLFRTSEIKFLESNWTLNNFGTSSRLSKPSHIAEITRNRIETLMAYYVEYY